MYPGREALLPGPGSGSKQVGKSPVTKVSGGAKTSGPKWMHTLMCVKWKREKVFLSSKMKCNQSLTDTNILSAKRKKTPSRLNSALVYGSKLEDLWIIWIFPFLIWPWGKRGQSYQSLPKKNIKFFSKWMIIGLEWSLTCFIYILDSSFSSSFKFWSSQFISSSICIYNYSSNDSLNDWLLSLELPFCCMYLKKDMSKSCIFLFQVKDLIKMFCNVCVIIWKWIVHQDFNMFT